MSDIDQNLMFLEAETDFGLSLLNTVASNESFVFSPISIALALSLVHVGAKDGTKTEISRALLKGADDEQFANYFSNVSQVLKNAENGVETNIANRMFASDQFKINEQYLEEVEKYYDAKAENVNFGDTECAAETINNFVSNNTAGKIQNFVKADQLEGALALIVNAIFFKAKWWSEFEPALTSDIDFFTAENEPKSLPFMRQSMETENYSSDDLFEVLQLRYKDLSYSFAVFLPKVKFGLNEALKQLDAHRFQSLLSNLKSTLVSYKLPKMKITKELELKTALQSLGIEQLFSDSADLSGIAPEIKISDGFHKAVIEVDEAGTIAAAATGIKIVPVSAVIGDPIYFVPDHPFLFALLKDTHPIFLGTFFG